MLCATTEWSFGGAGNGGDSRVLDQDDPRRQERTARQRQDLRDPDGEVRVRGWGGEEVT